MRVMYYIFFALVLLLAGCVPHREQTPDTPGNAFALKLPAVYRADLSLKECPPMSFVLTLRPDGLYFLRAERGASDAGTVQAEVGVWQSNAKRNIIQLNSYDNAVLILAVTRARRLRVLKVSGGIMPSLVRYDFVLTDTVQADGDDEVQMRGMYTNLARGGIFRECLSGITFPVTKGWENTKLEQATLNALHGQEKSVYAVLDARLSSRRGKGERIIPVRFIDVDPSLACDGEESRLVTIMDSRWRLTEMNGEELAADSVEKIPFLKVKSRDGLIEGFAGCNRFSGTWLFEEGTFSFSRTAATRMACPVGMEVEDAFLRALDDTREYQITDGILELVDRYGKVQARLRHSRRLIGVERLSFSKNGSVVEPRLSSKQYDDMRTLDLVQSERKVELAAGDSVQQGSVNPSAVPSVEPRGKKVVPERPSPARRKTELVSTTDVVISGKKSDTPIPENQSAESKRVEDPDTIDPDNQVAEPEAVEESAPVPSEDRKEKENAPERPSSGIGGEKIAPETGVVIPGKETDTPESDDKLAESKRVDLPPPAPVQSDERKGKEDGENITESEAEAVALADEIAEPASQAGPPSRSSCGKPWKTPLAEITGKIKKVEYRSPPWTGERGLHLDVETSSGKFVVIHVFPEKLTSQCPQLIKFTPEEEVTFSGSEFFTGKGGSQRNICVATINRDSNVLRLRNPTTSAFDRRSCCQELCREECAGKPPMCINICTDKCQDR